MKVAISKNIRIFNHSGAWTDTWIEFCRENNIDYIIIDCYQPDVIEKLRDCDCLLWHFSNYVLPDMMIARSVLYSAKNMGIRIFPDFESSWHFDDKVAETYLLESVNASIPASWMFYLHEDCAAWLKSKAQFPLIAKLRCGSGSHNVKLLKTRTQALKYSSRMFKKGFKTQPHLIFKAKSQLMSSRSFSVVKARMKRIPEFLRTLSRAKMFPKEHGYVFFQEFIPNDGYDLKIVVIGDKLSFIGRHTRKGDFRASGGGNLFFEKKLVTKSIISSAFETSDRLGFACMGYDYVVDKNDGTGKIVEISYGFSHTALLEAGGYFDRGGEWHSEPLNAPVEVLRNILKITP